jgi:hypothetical protein
VGEAAAAGREAGRGVGPSRRCAGTRRRRPSHREERGGEGEGKREREREREGHLRDPNSGDHHLQDLGHHHGGRERGGREVAARKKSNERKRPGEGGHAHGEGTGARGARAEAWPSWADVTPKIMFWII